MLAPLAIFVYNRKKCTVQMLEALGKSIGAKDTKVYIFSDGPKNKSDEIKVKSVRDAIYEYKYKNIFKEVNIIESNNNKGLANSIISGVTSLLNQFGKIIVVEDDLIVAKEFIIFMNECLDYYKENSSIWSIGGTTLKMRALSKYDKSVYACYRGSSWGWATWKDRWDKVDWNVSDYTEFMKDKKRKKLFQRGGEDTVIGLKKQMEGKTDSWAIRWIYQQSKENMYTILPVESLVKNIGFDGTGVHSGKRDTFHTEVQDKIFHYVLEDVEINEKIMKDFRKYFKRTIATKILDYLGLEIKR